MSSITFDVGNAPSVLAALRDPRNAQLVANAMAESYTNDIHDWIGGGHGFFTHRAQIIDDKGKVAVRASGQLQQATNWRPAGNGSAEVYANTDYARYVEEGTKPHVIRPKDRKALRFPVGGGAGFGFARVINHPGSKAHPFFFADRDNRMDNMQAAAMSVLARVMAGQHG